jgi:HK97 gp10 family phage protein
VFGDAVSIARRRAARQGRAGLGLARQNMGRKRQAKAIFGLPFFFVQRVSVSVKINFNTKQLQEQLQATADKMHAATRPAAQAGSQLIYDRARLNAPVSKKPHFFTIKGRRYGPFQPGNLKASIYQVFAQKKSFKDVSTYEVSFNRTKAPYGYMVSNGTSKTTANPFIARAVIETRKSVRDAIKARFIAEVNKK